MNKRLYIDKEAIATLAMLKEGLFKPVTRLMNSQEDEEVNKTGQYKGELFPFSFILAPNGKRNKEVLSAAKKGEKIELVCEGKTYGDMIVDEIFPVDKEQRVEKIYGTSSLSHPGVKETLNRLGELAICGEYNIEFDDIQANIEKTNALIKETEAKSISSIILSGKPFHRVHERLIRTALVKCDILIVFLQKPYHNDNELDYSIRKKTLEYFMDNFIPKDRIILLPLENTYIFGGINELKLNAIVSRNYGATRLLIGQNHGGIGAYWDHNKFLSIVDTLKDIGIKIEILSEFVYCDQCRTLVSTNACPHGSHHHVKYHNDSIMELFRLGIIPPAILMRKEISSIILSELYPERKERLQRIHQTLSTSSGLIDEFKSEDFYDGLMHLYQTSSLT